LGPQKAKSQVSVDLGGPSPYLAINDTYSVSILQLESTTQCGRITYQY